MRMHLQVLIMYMYIHTCTCTLRTCTSPYMHIINLWSLKTINSYCDSTVLKSTIYPWMKPKPSMRVWAHIRAVLGSLHSSPSSDPVVREGGGAEARRVLVFLHAIRLCVYTQLHAIATRACITAPFYVLA